LRHNANQSVDVGVLGGGPAGTATALALSRVGYSVVVIEKSAYNNVRIGETLPPGVQTLLTSLGVWDRFLADKHSPSFGNCSAWGQDDLYDNDFIFSPYGTGWHVDRSCFDAMLACCAEEAGASVCRGARLLSCENDVGNWKIEIACDDRKLRFRTKFLVDASGRASYAARQQGAKRVTRDRLIGVFFFFSSSSQESASHGSTLIEAVEDGWWYSAVLPDSRLVLAYMTDADLYARARKQSNNSCLGKLQTTKHTQSRVEPFVLAGGPFIVPANSSRLDRVTNGNWLAIGDAAMAFDPLSGQGVYKALASALRSAKSIQEYWTGNKSALRDYAAVVERDFDDYLLMRGKFYAREQRWPESVFWQRRISDQSSPNRS
jgi:flavin-dependent dehydrogenase